MRGFDIVLGMDWLASNDADILCKKKMIRIPLENGSEALVYSDRRERKSCLISMIKARRCLGKGCVGYLAYVLDAKKEKCDVEDVPIVREYPKVFPDDLTGLPLDRQIEFKIDLVPGAAPVARAPYRLAPA